MVIVKRLYTFMLQRFLPLLLMTFFICLFIVLMQFLWRYIDDLVGKGLPIKAIAELFFYAALSMVPTALPLAVLLASLMTFGNLGEKFELTALKAAGISLFKIMKPLIVLMVLIAIGAFFFQNDVLPIAQTRMWATLFSMRQKSPEVEIPERSFYDQIPGVNLYIERKNQDTGMLYDMIIYYTESQGSSNSRVILADSGKLNFTEDKTRLFLHLYQGEMFENLRDNVLGSSNSNYMPFRRESFSDKQIYLTFDANYNRMNDSIIGKQYVGKNISQLLSSIDSLQHNVDSIGARNAESLKLQRYVSMPIYERQYLDTAIQMVPVKPVAMETPLNVDSLFDASSPSMAKQYVAQAQVRAKQAYDQLSFQALVLMDEARLMRRHDIEMQRRFTLSVACLIFFFIGAPLGAIIKKGGIGTPLVISVLLFIFYYIIDNTGYKLARDGKIEVWMGIWLSSAVLLPLGIFFTYKAVGDSAVFNVDAYINFFNRLRGKRFKRTLEPKEVIMTEVDALQAERMLSDFIVRVHAAAEAPRTLPQRLLGRPPLTDLDERFNNMIDYLSNSRDKRIVGLLNEYPFNLDYRNLGHVVDVSELLLRRLRQCDE